MQAFKAIEVRRRGWDIGVQAGCQVDGNGRDYVTVIISRGSNGAGSDKFLGNFYIDDKGEIQRVGDE